MQNTPMLQSCVHESWVDVPALDDDLISVDAAIADGARTIAAQPNYPRNLTVTITDGDTSISAYTLVIIGVDARGRTITDTFTFADGLTPATAQAYATVTSATVSGLTGNGAGDNIKIGVGNLLGLAGRAVSGYKYLVDNANTTVPTISALYCTVDTGAVPDGSKDLQLWYRTAH